MSTNNITSAPWQPFNQHHSIALKKMRPDWTVLDKDGNLVAVCSASHPEVETIVKRIAAVNELLEALQFCQSVIKAQGMFDLSERMAYDKAEAAIKKATE